MYDCSGFFLLILKPAALTACSQQGLVLAGEPAPGAERVEAVAIAVLVDHGRERADLFEPLGRRHLDAGLGAQPSPIVETVLGDDAHAGIDVVSQPLEDLLAIKVLAVGMAQREDSARGFRRPRDRQR